MKPLVNSTMPQMKNVMIHDPIVSCARLHQYDNNRTSATSCVARSSLLTLIIECTPNRRPLDVRSDLPYKRRRLLSHPARLLMSVVLPPRLMNPMNQKPFVRYRSALPRRWLPSPSAFLLTTDGSQEPILAHPTSLCHTRTSCSALFPPHPVLLQPNPRLGDVLLNKRRPQCRRLSGLAIMLIKRPFRHLFRMDTHPRSHPALRLISRNMIW